jgi:hypothetical protein
LHNNNKNYFYCNCKFLHSTAINSCMIA